MAFKKINSGVFRDDGRFSSQAALFIVGYNTAANTDSLSWHHWDAQNEDDILIDYGGYTNKDPLPKVFIEALILNSVDYEVSYDADWAEKQFRETAYKFSDNSTLTIREYLDIPQNYKYLFFDTETTGLPRDWNAPVSDIHNWPRMMQIAWILCDARGNHIESQDFIIKPGGYTIPEDASDIHGITTEMAVDKGENLRSVLLKFNKMLHKADVAVAHNIGFDEKIVGAEFLREEMYNKIDSMKKLCTMQAATEYCKIFGPNGYKWPKLSELHIKLFGESFEEAHDASVDISATERCFWEMRRIGII